MPPAAAPLTATPARQTGGRAITTHKTKQKAGPQPDRAPCTSPSLFYCAITKYTAVEIEAPRRQKPGLPHCRTNSPKRSFCGSFAANDFETGPGVSTPLSRLPRFLVAGASCHKNTHTKHKIQNLHYTTATRAPANGRTPAPVDCRVRARAICAAAMLQPPVGSGCAAARIAQRPRTASPGSSSPAAPEASPVFVTPKN